MNKLKKFLTGIVPSYGWVPLILALSVNMAVYMGARWIAGDWYHYNIETSLDSLIPFWPPSSAIYLGCYIFWVINYILIARQEKKSVCQFFAGDILSRLICLLFFLLLPTTNIRPVVGETGFWNQVMRLVYSVDAADNLFPSIHCLVSWFCYIGIKKREEIPVWYQRFSCLIAVLICISTLTTKQHVIVDVIGGVGLAEFCFWIGKKKAVYTVYEKVINQINGKIFFRRKGEIHADEEKSMV